MSDAPGPTDIDPTSDDQSQPNPDPNSTHLKLVVSIHTKSATIGVARPGTDPYIQPFNFTDLDLLLDEVPGILMAAQAQWDSQPLHPNRNPSHTPPPPRQPPPQQDQPQQQPLSLF